MYDVIVVGGGPSGVFTAQMLANQGFHALVLEEHKEIGEPVQCAGLISPRTLNLAGVSENIIINQLTGARVLSPLGGMLDIRTGQVHALAVDRAAFDRQLAIQAQNAGADVLTGAKVKGLKKNAGGFQVFVQTDSKEISCQARLIIGADGANSRVAKWLGLNCTGPRAIMYAADVELSRPEENDLVDIFVGRNMAPGWFGWLIPLNKNMCRVGTGFAFSRPGHSPRYFFQHIIESFPEYFKGFKILKYTGGTVPMGLMPKIYAPNAMLVGDAAWQTKPVSGGGIYPGMRGAQLCAQVAAQALKEDNLSEKTLSRYQLLWNEEFSQEIRCGLSHRESYLNFSDRDIDLLLRFLNKPYWQNIISKYGDIDYPSILARPLFNAGPWTRGFVKAAVYVAEHGSALKKGIKSVFSW